MSVELSPAMDETKQYRAISASAVATLVLAFLSLLSLIGPTLLVIPGTGLFVGIYSFGNIRRNSDHLRGGPMAMVGTVLCALILFGGSAYHVVTYAFEVPEGYRRVSFGMLQPEDKFSSLPVPRSAIDLNGKQIFIKGYVFPDGQKEGIRQFVLVPDMKSCCFGGNPKLTDMIEVKLRDGLTTHFSYTKRKLAGTFKVDTQLKPINGVGGVYYQLDADYVR